MPVKKEAGPPDDSPVRWQWFGAQKWHDYPPTVSEKIDRAYLYSSDKKNKYLRFWDGGMLREIDLVNMVQVPGRRKLRRIGGDVNSYCQKHGKPDLTVSGEEMKAVRAQDAKNAEAAKDAAKAANNAEAAKDAEARAKPKRVAHSVPSRRVPGHKVAATVRPAPGSALPSKTAAHSASTRPAVKRNLERHQAMQVNDPEVDMQEADHPKPSTALRQFLHPAFANMEEVAFTFMPLPPPYQPKTGSDRDDFLAVAATLAEEYEDCLTKGRPLPVRGSICNGPDQSFAAASIALYLNGPYADPSTREASPSDLSETASQSSGGSIWTAFQSLLPSASSPASRLGLLSRRPASAPAGGRAQSRDTGALSSALALVQSSVTQGTSAGSTSMPAASSSAPLPKLPTKFVFCVGRECPQTKLLARKMRDSWREWQNLCRKAVGVESLTALPCITLDKASIHYDKDHPHDFHWVHLSNHMPRRVDRVHCAMATLWHASKLRSTTDLSNETQLLRFGVGPKRRARSAAKPNKVFKMPTFCKTSFTALDEVVYKVQEKHKRAAAVFICSTQQVGGNFFLGLKPSEEEEAYMRSSFFFSMLVAQRAAKAIQLKDHNGDHPHIPDDGAVLCKNVLVLRDRVDTGYAPYRSPVEAPAIYAISMPPKSMEKGMAASLIRMKIDTILKSMAELKIDSLVVSESGAGHADALFAREVGAALGLAMHGRDKELVPKQVVVCGGRSFFEVVKAMETNTELHCPADED